MEDEVKARTKEVTQQKEEIEHTYHNVKLLSEIGKQITSCLSVGKIIETAYENINQLMDASSFWIGIHNATTQRLDYPLGIEKGKMLDFAYYDLTDDERLPVWCFKNQKEAFVNDYLKEYNSYIPGASPPVPVAGEMPESSIWIPLISNDKKTFGILTIQSFQKNAYTEYHLNIARNLAVFTSIGLENALLYEQVEQKVKERTSEVVRQKEEIEFTYQTIKVLSEIGQQITSCLSVEKIIETAYENVNRLMDASVFWIGIYNEKESRLDFTGAIEKAERIPFFDIKLNDRDRLASWCFNNQKSIFINDLATEFKTYFPHLDAYNAVVGEIPSSIIYLPLISKTNKQVGVITVQSFAKNAYTGYHLDILKNLAVFVNIALENALMYEHVEQKVIERTAQVVKQKEELEEKNKDITDSINYAKRIQEAILPPMEMCKDLFPESFILFHPRDIVSGDFYWFAEKNGKRLIAAVDCTGHGVPGAFMSMIGNSFLNEIVNERGITQPDLILNKLRDQVIHSLKQSEAENRANDGMDISLLCFEEKQGRLSAQWAGANNSLWLIRDGICIPYHPDKRPISYSRGQELPFTNHSIDLQKGDLLYIFSDGFADQFGGDRGKKFKYKQLQEVLLSIRNEAMHIQEKRLLQAFNNWKGALEQVDDVLIIGVRV
jgi:serine phosphatase RsbU (regulator of sigma subunit)